MTQQHPIIPPPELVVEWADTIYQQTECDDQRDLYVATQAARWGADQELEACCALMELSDSNARDFLQSARRPQLLSLKEQALDALAHIATGPNPTAFLDCQDTIRCALEQLP
jgi:hypothetical protein